MAEGFNIGPVRPGTPIVSPTHRPAHRDEERPRNRQDPDADTPRQDEAPETEDEAGVPPRPAHGDGIDVLA